MNPLPLRLRSFQILVLGLMACTIGACAEGARDRLDVNGPISAKQLFVAEQGRFSKAGIGLPKGRAIQNALEVNGTILAEEILVQAEVADYVFSETYDLQPLDYVEDYIEAHHHLPGIAPTSAVNAAGGTIPIGDSYRVLLEKIEELTLYTIEQNKRIVALENYIAQRCASNGETRGDH